MDGVRASQRLRLASRTPSNRGDMLIPAQSQEHVWLNDVLLQLRPFLPGLRRKLSSLVRSVHRYYGAVRLLQHVHVRRSVYGLRGPAFAYSRRRAGDLPVLVHVVSQRARALRLRRTEPPLAITRLSVLPSSSSEWSRHPDLPAFRSSITPPTDASGLRFETHLAVSSARLRSGWSRCLLSRRALTSPTTCRFIPALSGLPTTRQST